MTSIVLLISTSLLTPCNNRQRGYGFQLCLSFCVSVCAYSERKTAWAINTKVSRNIVHCRPWAFTDTVVTRSKDGQWKAWVCMSVQLHIFCFISGVFKLAAANFLLTNAAVYFVTCRVWNNDTVVLSAYTMLTPAHIWQLQSHCRSFLYLSNSPID